LLSGVALTLVGGALGAGVVAWQSDSLPFLNYSPCWGSVTDQDLDELFGEETRVSHIAPERGGRGLVDGRCRIASHDDSHDDRRLDIRFHQLSGREASHNVPWSEDFLSSRLTPLGDGLLGMASDTRAWVALPDTCVKPGLFSGPAVVDLSMGDSEIANSEDPETRAALQTALARTAVHVANGAMERLGCSEPLPEPGPTAAVPDYRPVGADRSLCGAQGAVLPEHYVESEARIRMSAGENSPVRTCDIVYGHTIKPQLRLETIEEEDLTGALGLASIHGGRRVEVTGQAEVNGAYSPTLSAVRAECPKGAVLFMAQERQAGRDFTFIRRVFPAYVKAEAQRLGCGPLTIKIPDDSSAP
jgi:hypothetical protein